MKKTSIFAACGAALLLPSPASATLLVGFQDFPALRIVNLSPPDDFVAGFTGSVSGASTGVKGVSGPGGNAGGSHHTEYNGTSVPTAATNGYAAIGSTTPLTAVFNMPPGSSTLDALVFDVLTLSNGTTAQRKLSILYTVDSTPNAPLVLLESQTLSRFSSSGAQYFATGVNLEDIEGFSNYIKFQFTVGSGGALLDNIAVLGNLSPVPETGVVLGLVGLMGAGSLFRRRPAKA